MSHNALASIFFSWAAVLTAATLDAVAGRWVVVVILALSIVVPFGVGVYEAHEQRRGRR